MIRQRHPCLVGLLTLLCVSFGLTAVVGSASNRLPARLTDGEFWQLISDFSEPDRSFISDNFVSNEDAFQRVIPRLTQTPRGGVYLGVGPDQNFTYIVALRPQMAFIIDIRRQNLLLHLLYKALIEISDDRAEFLSRLFSRPRPSGLGDTSSINALMAAYEPVAASDALFEKNQRAVVDRLVRHHHFGLTRDDLTRLSAVYAAFVKAGPDIRYSIPPGPLRFAPLEFPSYADLMRQTDAEGESHGYLATEANFRVLKEFERQNRIVPVVGDFAGNRALPGIGQYLRQHGSMVTAFYVSNVEMYLFNDLLAWRRFYATLASLPADRNSTLIRSYNLNAEVDAGGVRLRLATTLDSMEDFVHAVGDGQIHQYTDVTARSR
jgi:hypothetical protein